jgi:subtilase family protein
MTLKTRFLTTVGVAALALGLYGCGGGGGGSTAQPSTNLPSSNTTTTTPPPPPPPPPPTTPADTFRTVEYNLMGGLEQVHAADAYARGYTGQGVIIGIVDFNFILNSPEVNYSTASVDQNAAIAALYAAETGSPNDPSQHGHAVASTAAARKNDSGIQGIAFGATVLAVDYLSDVNDVTDAEQFGGKSYIVHTSDPFTYITSHGGRIVNTSYGYEAGSGSQVPSSVTELYGTVSPATAVANGALLVASAGNGGLNRPALSNFDIADDLRNLGILDSGPGAFIIAGAVTSSNTIASFSDKAGIQLQNYYMVAPGVNLTLPWDGSLQQISGTSFSAPLISGAAAIVMQRWPNLTARQVADILLNTATDLGTPGVDSTYGHGLLNVDAALQPNGVTTFATSGGVDVATGGTGLVLGQAFGDAKAFRAALTSTTILDSYGRDFTVDLAGAAITRPGLPDMFGVMQQRLGWHFAGLPVGETSHFDLDVRENVTDSIAPFGAAGGLENDLAQHQAVARFEGETGAIGWLAGTGVSLRDALAPTDAGDPFATLALTQGFAQAVGGAPSGFVGARLALDRETQVSFGAARTENQGIPSYYLPQQFHNTGETMALRLDRRSHNSIFGLEFGTLIEDGGVLGSLASGALKMADSSATSWISASYEQPLLGDWSFKGSMTVSATGMNAPSASLITKIGPIYATSFTLGVGRSDVFDAGDALTFAVDQPLRVESAPVSLSLGAGMDYSTGKVVMVDSRSSLAPSGREIDFESGYRFPLGDWSGAMNLAYSVDAGHIRGETAVSGLFWVSRKF